MKVRSTRSSKLSEGVRGAVNDLIDDLKRLQPNQGAQARRNGRFAVLHRLRNLRRVLDAEFPCEPRAPKKARAKPLRCLTDEGVEKRLADRGLVRLANSLRERELLMAGVRIIPVELKGLHLKYAAAWAVEAPEGTPVAMLRKGRRSQQVRDALRSAAAMLTSPKPPTTYTSASSLPGTASVTP